MTARYRSYPIGLLLLAATTLLLPACGTDGQFEFLGYTTRPNYDPTIRTVRVTIFGNETLYRGIEFDLTRAIIREIESKTPFKVVSGNCDADTELVGQIVSFNKNLVIYNQFNEVRDAQTTLAVKLTWRDLRLGFMGDAMIDPLNAPPGPPPGMPGPPGPKTTGEKVLVQSLGSFRPELGESITTARQQMINKMATEIVSMMEVWH